MNTEQLRAEFEAWAQDKTELYKMSNGEYSSRITRFAFESYQAGRAALQSQATEAFPCRIVEADFETGTVTLEMHGKYTVSSGHKYLCDAPLQSQDREDAERYRWLRAHHNVWGRIESGHSGNLPELFDEAIDHARRNDGGK